MSRAERLVSSYYADFVEPLGALVILFAQAEQALVDLIKKTSGCSEAEAVAILGSDRAESASKEKIVSYSFPSRAALDDALTDFWRKKEKRNRYIHDEWFISINYDDQVEVVTRQGPRRKRNIINSRNLTSRIFGNLRSISGRYEQLSGTTSGRSNLLPRHRRCNLLGRRTSSAAIVHQGAWARTPRT